jgi:spore maturation protein CgeB
MIKYIMTAAALKLFSTSSQTKCVYRRVEMCLIRGGEYTKGFPHIMWIEPGKCWNYVQSISLSRQVDILPQVAQNFHRLLKSGGYSIHKIDPSDHLYYYDTSVSQKNYLRYSDRVWKRYFENHVQYINRIQRSEWLDLFHKAGFELVEEESVTADIGLSKIDKDYQDLDIQDLQCVTLTIIHRKR